MDSRTSEPRRDRRDRRDRGRDARVVAAYRSGQSLRKVGAEFGISGERVRQLLARAGVATRSPVDRRYNRGEAVRLYQDGMGIPEISRRLGVAICTVHRGLVSDGVQMRRPGRPANPPQHQPPANPAAGQHVPADPRQRRDVGRLIFPH